MLSENRKIEKSNKTYIGEFSIPKYENFQFKEKMTKYCLIIPVINEGKRFILQIHKIKKFSNIIDIIIADGGSDDGSVDLEFLRLNKIRTLLIKKDSTGLSGQLRMGFGYALQSDYEGIITIDGNNKDDINSIPDFINELNNGYDFIQGSRYVKGGKAINTPFVRDIAIRFIHAPIISLISGFKYTDTTNGFRAYSTKYLLGPSVHPFRDIFDKYELMAYLSVKAPKLGFLTKEIPTTRTYPIKGEVPTKIKGFKSNFYLLLILGKLFINAYDPKE